MLDETHGQLQAPLIAAREIASVLVLHAEQADVFKHMLGLSGELPVFEHRLEGPELEGAIALGQGGNLHILHNGKIEKDVGCLKNPGNAELIDLVRLPAGQNLAVKHHRAGVGRQAAHTDVQKRRLAGAVRSDHRMGASLLNLQIDVREGAQAAEAFVHVGDIENDIFHGTGRSLL